MRMAKSSLHQNLLGRIVYPSESQKGYDGLPDPRYWGWARLKSEDQIPLVARIVAVRDGGPDKGCLVLTLETSSGKLADNILITGVKLAPEGAVLVTSTTHPDKLIAVPGLPAEVLRTPKVLAETGEYILAEHTF
jgi:hypothetical protein